jgi:hypothetical protein
MGLERKGLVEEDLIGYVAPFLDGIWLKAPYLHNGSVPTLRDLLEPAAQRPKVFWRGYDVYDQAKVGFVSDTPEAQRVGTRLDRQQGRRQTRARVRTACRPKDALERNPRRGKLVVDAPKGSRVPRRSFRQFSRRMESAPQGPACRAKDRIQPEQPVPNRPRNDVPHRVHGRWPMAFSSTRPPWTPAQESSGRRRAEVIDELNNDLRLERTTRDWRKTPASVEVGPDAARWNISPSPANACRMNCPRPGQSSACAW